MNKQYILELLKSSKWTPAEVKLFIGNEYSQTLTIWDKEYAFSIHGVRNVNLKDDVVLVVTQMRPKLKFDVTFDTIEPVLNNSMKYMFSEQLLNNREERHNFIKG